MDRQLRYTLSYCFPEGDKEIENGTQLIVRETQQVQFVAAGKDTLTT